MTHIHPRDDFGYRFHRRPPNALAKKRLVLTIWLNVFMMIGEIVGTRPKNRSAIIAPSPSPR